MKTKHKHIFDTDIHHLREMMKSSDKKIKQLLTVYAITLLETYLSGLVKELAVSDRRLAIKLAETGYFKNTKISLADAIKSDPKQYLLALIAGINFHNFSDIEPMLKQAFDIKLTITNNLVDLIKLRNDIVHRNGHDKNGVVIFFDEHLADNAVVQVQALVEAIEEQVLAKYATNIKGA